jgi:hypothetical protein
MGYTLYFFNLALKIKTTKYASKICLEFRLFRFFLVLISVLFRRGETHFV